MIIVRPMEAREIDAVINLFHYYIQDADIEEFDEDRLLRTLREYNIRPNLFFRIATVGTRPVGVIGGFLSEDPVEREMAATIQFLYLLPEYHSQDNYENLISEFTQWARTHGADKIRAIDIGQKIDRLNSVYESLDFQPVRITIMNKEIA